MATVSWSSTVPTALDALTALLKTAFSTQMPDVLVTDSPRVRAETAEKVIAVGWNPQRETEADVISTGTLEGLAPSIREHFTIECSVLVRAGGTDGAMSAARRTAYNIAAAVGSVIAPDQTISGTVLRQTMASRLELRQTQDQLGALAVVTFQIACDAYSQQ